MAFLITAVLLSSAVSQIVAPKDRLTQEQAIAAQFESQVHFAALEFHSQPPRIMIETLPTISSFDGETIREARFEKLPPPAQTVFNQWATYTSDQPSGEKLFGDMFYRFFFVHELGHWVSGQVIRNRKDRGKSTAAANMARNHWQMELECNRIAVAWWREHDPAYLAKLMADFSAIEERLPNPVPAGQLKQEYFAANYERLGNDPQVYGWFLLQSALDAYNESPMRFQSVLDALPTAAFR